MKGSNYDRLKHIRKIDDSQKVKHVKKSSKSSLNSFDKLSQVHSHVTFLAGFSNLKKAISKSGQASNFYLEWKLFQKLYKPIST